MHLTACSWDGLYRTFPTEPESVASLSWVIWWALHFCILAKWVMAGCRLWTTAASVYCALHVGKSCRTWALQGSKEGRKKNVEKLVLFLRGQLEWLFTEMYCTAQLFLVPDALGGSETTPAAVESHRRACWETERARTWGKKAKKMRETTSQSL